MGRMSIRGVMMQGALAASALLAFFSIIGFLIVPLAHEPGASMRIEPEVGTREVGSTFQVQIIVEGSVPVNVFKGELHFDPNVLSVESIDYNTSLADLWAEKPWYENGAGTINFIGGTTRPGGFFGKGTLMSIHFRAHGIGRSTLQIIDPRILAHDGLGTDVVLVEPIDALFAVEVPSSENVSVRPAPVSILHVVTERQSVDLNGDGNQSIADVSIFMRDMFSGDVRSDFNLDGTVDAKDLSIIMSAE